MKDIVVLLPGILGSVLERDGKEIWSVSAGAAWKALISLGQSIKQLEIAGDDDPSLDDLGDGVTASRLMSDIHLIPSLWRIDGYGVVSNALRKRFGLTPGENYFEFPYDWRRDNRVHGRRLRRQSQDWLKARRQKYSDARLILIAHSMGGLVARAFLELEGGWGDTRALITFGTPYRGSLNALGFIANGFRKGIGPLSIDLTNMLRSFTSVYQLLPTYLCFDPGDGELVRPGETASIPNMKPVKARAALDFHREIRDRVNDHRQDQKYLADGYRIYPIVGYAQPTLQSALLRGDQVLLRRDRKGKDAGGDGTVPRPSAIPEEMGDPKRAMFSASAHSSVQNAEEVLNHLQGLFTSDYDPEDYYAAAGTLSLDVEDVFYADEEIVVRAQCSEPGAIPWARIEDTETAAVVATNELMSEVDDGWMQGAFQPLPPGSYRITVGAEGVDAQPVSDLFVVFKSQ